jgi:hypothetical protein
MPAVVRDREAGEGRIAQDRQPHIGPSRKGMLMKQSSVGGHWKARHFVLENNQVGFVHLFEQSPLNLSFFSSLFLLFFF